MCGISGIYSPKIDKAEQKELLSSMLANLYHRGPDGWGIYVSDTCSIGNTRLSIFDVDNGFQPMMNERYVVAYNGEVYNFIELQGELKQLGYKFSTTCDTEVILNAFTEYGTECFKKFNGQFAILIYDRSEKRLIVARDRYGIRPLYVYNNNGKFYFASEIKAFDVIPGFRRELNINNIYEHGLFWNTLDDRTVYKNIRSIRAGSFEIYKDTPEPVTGKYYELGETVTESPKLFNEAKEEFDYLLNDAVKMRLRSDVPVADYLSGGIDSSVITYLTAQNKKEKFSTFSVAFNDKDFDESGYQLEMVDSLQSKHNAVNIDYENIRNNFAEAVYHFERPVFRTAPVPLFKLSELVRQKNFKVVLTGEAADEILFGYDSYKELKLLEFWSRQPESKIRPQLLKKLYPHYKHFKDPRQFGLMRIFYEGFLNKYSNELAGLNIRVHNNDILANYLNKDYQVKKSTEELISDVRKILPNNFDNWTILQKNQFLEMKTLLSGYLLSSQGDRMSMSNSVEGRYPFLDHRLVEKVFYYKDEYKLNGFYQKNILRQAYREKIPASIIDRPKMPYQAPDLKSFFINTAIYKEGEYLLSKEQIEKHGIFDPVMIGRFLNKFRRGIPENIGYRDNMLITFILSTQLLCEQATNPRKNAVDLSLKKVEIID